MRAGRRAAAPLDLRTAKFGNASDVERRSAGLSGASEIQAVVLSTAVTRLTSWSRMSLWSTAMISSGWNKAWHPLPCGKPSATFLTCAF